jgi:hypothetical protein
MSPAKAAHRYSLDVKHAFLTLLALSVEMDFSLVTAYAIIAQPRIFFAQDAALMETYALFAHSHSSLVKISVSALQSHL